MLHFAIVAQIRTHQGLSHDGKDQTFNDKYKDWTNLKLHIVLKESVRRTTRMNTTENKFVRLQLPTVKYGRTKGDMIRVYKILKNKYDNAVKLHLK